MSSSQGNQVVRNLRKDKRLQGEMRYQHWLTYGTAWKEDRATIQVGKKNSVKILNVGFPGGAVVKNLPANAGDTGSSPGPGRSHMLRSN